MANTMNGTISKDIKQGVELLKRLARQANSEVYIQALAAKEIAFEGKTVICAEMVFLTEKQHDDITLERIKNWLGIGEEVPSENLFNGKIIGNIKISKELTLNIQTYHFDHYPVQRLSEEKKALKIVIYDPEYKASYKNWYLAQEMLEKDPAVCLLLNTQPEVEIAEEEIINIDGVCTQNLGLENLGDSIITLFENPEFSNKIQIARLKNHIHYLEKVYGLVAKDIEDKTRQLQGKSMLAHKKQWQNQQKSSELSSRDITHLKSAVNTKLKQITKTIEQAIGNFEKEDENYINLEKDIMSFFGFVEHKSSKHLTFKMSNGAVQDKVNKANTALNSFYSNVSNVVKNSFGETAVEIKNQLTTWNLQFSDDIALSPEIGITNEEFLLNDSVTSGKSYEKQVPAKGIGKLLMELRTPLFMLMPFMMIFGLFGALVNGSSEGEISPDHFHNNKAAIIISTLPESWDSANEFIGEIEKKRKNGYFFKEISDGEALKLEPQLATIEEEIKKSFGSGTEIIKKLDAYINPNTGVIYLYLKEYADRDHIKEKLFDPSAKLLTAAASGKRGSMGIGGLIRLMSGLTEYRYLILGGLTGLICWFVITRRRSISKETQKLKEKEQRKLNEELKQHINKNIKQQLQRWKSGFIDQLENQQIVLQQYIEQLINNAIERRKQQKAQEYKIIQQRIFAVKSEKSLINSLKSEQRKLEPKLRELVVKARRLNN